MKSQYEAKIADLTNQLAARDRELGDLKGRIGKLEAQLGNMGSQGAAFQTTIDEMNKKIVNMTNEINSLNQ